MAYEGFQLLTYDYDDIMNPRKTLPRAVLSALVVVVIVYVIVALGTAMLIGADQVMQRGAGVRVITGLGALTAAAATAALVARLVRTDPMAIALLGLLTVIAVFGRPVLLRHMNTKNRRS